MKCLILNRNTNLEGGVETPSFTFVILYILPAPLLTKVSPSLLNILVIEVGSSTSPSVFAPALSLDKSLPSTFPFLFKSIFCFLKSFIN